MGIKTLAACLAAPALFLLAACTEPTANQGNVSNASGQASTPAGNQSASNPPVPAAEAPTWGKRYTWKDGLAIEISAPKPCKPHEEAIGAEKAQRAVKFTVTMINGTDKPVESVLVSVSGDAQFNGAKAELIHDSQGECGLSDANGTILPGKTFTYSMAYAVGAQPGEMQLSFDPNLRGDKAVFVGQA